MGGEWRQCVLGDIAAAAKNSLVGGPFGSNLVSADYAASGIPVIRGQNMNSGRWIEGSFVYVSNQKAKELEANTARPNDLVFTQRGTLGQVAVVPACPYDQYVISQSQMKLTVDAEKANSLYIYYLFNSEELHEYIRQTTIQTGVPHINLGILRQAPIRLPPLLEQQAIAQILGTLDDKIELNRRMNATLEEMARALFKSWFVDFDPVRAKMAGRETGLPEEIAALFPDGFEETAAGSVPRGWRVETVGQAFDVTMGQSPPGESYNEQGEGIPFFQGRADFTFRFPTHRVYCTAPTRFADPGDTLVSVRAPVGDVNMASEHCAIGRGVAAVRHKSGSRSFTYYAMRALEAAFSAFEAEGTVFGSISKKDFHELAFIGPEPEAVNAFERIVGPLDARIECNDAESRTLAALRDTLLPKLISGELRVGEAERFIQGVTE